MTPRPYVRNQGVLLAIALLAAAAIGATALVAVLVAATAAVATALGAAHVHAVKRVRASVPEHRASLDRLLFATTGGVTIIGVVAAIASAVLSAPVVSLDSTPAEAIVKALAVGSASVYSASLVDWYWVLPRITGMLGARPCRRDQPPIRAVGQSWEEVSRYWYWNRIVVAVIVMLAGAAVAFNVVRLVFGSNDAATIGAAVTAIMALLAEGYRQHLPWALMQALNPTTKVGDIRHFDGREVWAVDVSLEGVKYIDLDSHARRIRSQLARDPQGPRYAPKEDGSIALPDVRRLRRGSAPPPCPPDRCTGVNWYCIENRRCFGKPDD